ncbi:glycosyltransferase [Pararhizobium sp. BT-229]|uniref:glycosyltransferase n=1 Tax=Pararhizobium sp. BT-229 TaxID=2986923 RepID=UPI0021F71310|nr:glycosyltransferase [Pararhizobium sp. BT-229]MCV9967813.1 glycosyltransferase [Pararhizobium sp. BT-229]
MKPSRMVVISDFQDGEWESGALPSVDQFTKQWSSGARGAAPRIIHSPWSVEVDGGYIERLPLACLRSGLATSAEIWTHWRGASPPRDWISGNPHLTRRAFRLNGADAPFSSNDMLGHIQAFGPPATLCVWGLGVSEDILLACQKSFKIYNSIDAPPLRIPPEVSRHFDLVLTGAEWQSEAVLERHPEMSVAVLPIGPEFASETTFHPLETEKVYDMIYVAAAQPYKRHDILFEALAKLPRSLRALCVSGYGEMTESLRSQAGAKGIKVDFIGPPGVPFPEVNRLMNSARMGVVCGVDDGAPAILTEYMLAGIPVLANSALTCGLQYITPKTGRAVPADQFHLGILEILAGDSEFEPRQVVLRNWTWQHSVRKLQRLIELSPGRKF